MKRGGREVENRRKVGMEWNGKVDKYLKKESAYFHLFSLHQLIE
jgi:hypothetical protein